MMTTRYGNMLASRFPFKPDEDFGIWNAIAPSRRKRSTTVTEAYSGVRCEGDLELVG
jgi:hypothetical protein